jgi:hypothetical protein
MRTRLKHSISFKRKLIFTSFDQVITLDWEIIRSSSPVQFGYQYLHHGQNTGYDDWKYGGWGRTDMLINVPCSTSKTAGNKRAFWSWVNEIIPLAAEFIQTSVYEQTSLTDYYHLGITQRERKKWFYKKKWKLHLVMSGKWISTNLTVSAGNFMVDAGH